MHSVVVLEVVEVCGWCGVEERVLVEVGFLLSTLEEGKLNWSINFIIQDTEEFVRNNNL